MSKAHVFVDFKEVALQDTGDFIDPVRNGAISKASIEAECMDLSKGLNHGRAA